MMMTIKEFESYMKGLIDFNVTMRNKEELKESEFNNETLPLKIIFNEIINQKETQIKTFDDIIILLDGKLIEGKAKKVLALKEYVGFLKKQLEDSVFLDKEFLKTITNETLPYANLKMRKHSRQTDFIDSLRDIYYRNLVD